MFVFVFVLFFSCVFVIFVSGGGVCGVCVYLYVRVWCGACCVCTTGDVWFGERALLCFLKKIKVKVLKS